MFRYFSSSALTTQPNYFQRREVRHIKSKVSFVHAFKLPENQASTHPYYETESSPNSSLQGKIQHGEAHSFEIVYTFCDNIDMFTCQLTLDEL